MPFTPIFGQGFEISSVPFDHDSPEFKPTTFSKQTLLQALAGISYRATAHYAPMNLIWIREEGNCLASQDEHDPKLWHVTIKE